MSVNEPPSPVHDDEVRRFVKQAGWGEQFSCIPLGGGANNRVWKLVPASTDQQPLVLKQFFRGPAGSRDRCSAEWTFASHAHHAAAGRVPAPRGYHAKQGLALYDFIDGEKPRPEFVSRSHLDEMLQFYRLLNTEVAGQQLSAAIGPASETWDTPAGHVACVDRRLRNLACLDPSRPHGGQAKAFLEQALQPVWRQVKLAYFDCLDDLGLELNEPLSGDVRRLSPSDFGLHNTIERVAADGDRRLVFFDFEHAGWDDPAKMVCDMFCQPAIPLDQAWFTDAVRAVTADLPEPDRHAAFARGLLPIYRIKWCCILLNEFLPEGLTRRRFADQQAAAAERLAGQLEKAAAMLGRLKPTAQAISSTTP